MVAINSEGVLVGYVVTTQNGALNYFKHITFKDEEVYHELKKNKHLLIDQIAIDKELQGIGIGSLLIKEILNKEKQIILSFVAVEPFYNEISIKFHETNHFIHIGDFCKDVFLDRENYVSYLYMIQT